MNLLLWFEISLDLVVADGEEEQNVEWADKPDHGYWYKLIGYYLRACKKERDILVTVTVLCSFAPQWNGQPFDCQKHYAAGE